MLNLKTLNGKLDYSGAIFFTNNDYCYNCKTKRNKSKLIKRLNSSNLQFKNICSNKKYSDNIAIYYRNEQTYIVIYGTKNLLFNSNLLDILDVINSKYFKYMKISNITSYKETRTKL